MSESPLIFQELLSTVNSLRDPEHGCPWDLEQTHESLVKYLEEESAELICAINNYDEDGSADPTELVDELGDVLLQVLLHSQIGSDNGNFSIDDVMKNLNAKLIRRHPHVFGDSSASSIDEVEDQWRKIKEEEKRRIKKKDS